MEQANLLSPAELENKQRLYLLLREKKKALALSDLFYFGKFVLGYDFEEQPHRSYCEDLQNPHLIRKMNLEPRGIFKTTITIAYILWKIVHNPNIRVLIDCEDLSLSKQILGEIKTHIERNDEFRSLFGDLVGKEKWTELQVVVKTRTAILKDPTINTSSIEVNRTGAHVDLLIEDDLHSKFNTQTPEQIEKVYEHYKLNQSILDPGGEEIINGTRWAVRELYGILIEQERSRRKSGLGKKYHVRTKNAEISGPGGTLYFPSRLTKEFLADKKLEQGSYVYACQYLNNPVDADAVKFKPHWIRFYGRYAPDNLIITQTLDPAISTKDDACYSNINTIGTDADGYMYLLDNYRFRAETNILIDEMFRAYQKWNPRSVGIEVYAFQKSLKYWIAERSRRTGVFLPVHELKTDTKISKEFRIKALIPYVENGTIQFPGTGPQSLTGGMLDLYNEMIEFPVGAYLDALDSLSSQLELYHPASIKKVKPEVVNTFQYQMNKERKARIRTGKKGLPLVGRYNRTSRSEEAFIQVFQKVNR